MVNLGIVVPCFNEEDVLGETVKRLAQLVGRLSDARLVSDESRIYLIDDGSVDKTWKLISQFVRDKLPVVGVKLSTNRGHQNALLAGLFTAKGDVLISVDADLQDDLGAIETMLQANRDGADIVFGVRRRRDTDTFLKRFSAESFYRIMAAMGARTVFNHADYRLMSRRAVEALRGYREVNLFLRGIVPLIGFRTAVVEYDRAARFAGESKYPLPKMLALSIDAITSFSVFPLRLISLLGFVVFAGSMCVTAWALWIALLSARAVPGWASTVLPMYFLGGVQLLALGVIGEYVGKIYMETKSRPRFLVELVLDRVDSDRVSNEEAAPCASPAGRFRCAQNQTD